MIWCQNSNQHQPRDFFNNLKMDIIGLLLTVVYLDEDAYVYIAKDLRGYNLINMTAQL